MGVFYVLLLVPMVIQHISIKGVHIDYEKRNRIAIYFFFLWLTILVMLRHESVGSDTRNYMHFFERFSVMSWTEVGSAPFESGFSYFNKMVSLFSKESQFYLAVATIAVSAMIYPTYKRLCIDSTLTVVLFCTMSTFVMMFSGIRQMIAIGIGFVAYEFTRGKRVLPFLISVCVAITFHTSSFMLAFMYPLYHAKITKKWLYVIVPLLIFTFIFNIPIFSVLSIFVERYTTYDSSITSTGAYTMLLLFAVFTAFSFIIPEESIVDKETIGLRNFLLFALALQMFAPLHTLAMRMNYYYIIFIPLLIPKIIEYRSKRWKQVAVAGRHIMVGFFLIYFFINAIGEGNLNVFPYHFFWEQI